MKKLRDQEITELQARERNKEFTKQKMQMDLDH